MSCGIDGCRLTSKTHLFPPTLCRLHKSPVLSSFELICLFERKSYYSFSSLKPEELDWLYSGLSALFGANPPFWIQPLVLSVVPSLSPREDSNSFASSVLYSYSIRADFISYSKVERTIVISHWLRLQLFELNFPFQGSWCSVAFAYYRQIAIFCPWFIFLFWRRLQHCVLFRTAYYHCSRSFSQTSWGRRCTIEIYPL